MMLGCRRQYVAASRFNLQNKVEKKIVRHKKLYIQDYYEVKKTRLWGTSNNTHNNHQYTTYCVTGRRYIFFVFFFYYSSSTRDES